MLNKKGAPEVADAKVIMADEEDDKEKEVKDAKDRPAGEDTVPKND